MIFLSDGEVSLWKAASYAISTRLSFLTIRVNGEERFFLLFSIQ